LIKYILSRLAYTVLILIGVTFIIFSITEMTPGDPGTLILGPGAKQEQIHLLNEQLGYYKPFIVRFFNYVSGIILHFDFGKSYKSNDPVLFAIGQRVMVTFRVAFSTIVLDTIFGVSIGVFCAIKQNTVIDNIISSISVIMTCVPAFWLALIFSLIFSLKLQWLPVYGITSWKGYVLPIATLVFVFVGGTIKFTRSIMLDTIRQDYVRTARAVGLKERTVIYGHALKNAMLPIVTNIGFGFAGLMGGMVILEMIFSLPGMGNLMYNAIMSKDLPMLCGVAIFLAALFCTVQLLVDLSYIFLDPRVRAKFNV
jgi:peptide/nickel transport system permease protein